MIVRALSVFEHIVYHSVLVDPSHPCRPTLEVEAVLRPGDADGGPLMLPLAEYVLMAGGSDAARPCIDRLRAQDRLADHLGVAHVTFPFWTPRIIDLPGTPATAVSVEPMRPGTTGSAE